MGFLKNIIFRVLGVLVGDYWKRENIWVGVSCDFYYRASS